MLVSIIVAFWMAQQKTITMELKKRYVGPNFETNEESILLSEEEFKRRRLATITKTMTNYGNNQYYSTLYIGDSQKTMTFIYDTGSTYLWVPLNNWSAWHTTNLYTPSGSFSTSGTRDSITYGSGSVSGVQFTDNVRVTSGGTAVNLST